jgi:hypothetical protein
MLTQEGARVRDNQPPQDRLQDPCVSRFPAREWGSPNARIADHGFPRLITRWEFPWVQAKGSQR